MRSSIAADDWLPVQQSLLRGLNHSLSNRLASLSALTMLIEGGDRLDSRMQDALSADVERLGGLPDRIKDGLDTIGRLYDQLHTVPLLAARPKGHSGHGFCNLALHLRMRQQRAGRFLRLEG